jgi:glycosyltransferase involved in cell wall biosynthesis
MLTAHRLLGTWERQVDMYIALTQTSRQKFIEGGLPAEKIAVKPNFIDPTPPAGTDRDDFALYVGRLAPEKGIETLLEAWESLDGLPLKIVGDGPLAEKVRAFIENNPNSRVQWLGYLPKDQVLDLMRKASSLVFPSIWSEPFGNSIIEAFASGLPVVASNMGSMAELVVDHKTGLHFRPGDAADLAAKLRWAQGHAAEMAAMGQTARKAYEASYTAPKNHEMLMEIYAQAKEMHHLHRVSS